MGAFIGLLLLLSAASAFAQGPWYFRATIGVDDGVLGRPGAAIFRVFVGEEKVYESPVMKPGDNPITLHVPLKREDVLTLEVADTGDGHGATGATGATRVFRTIRGRPPSGSAT